MPRHADDDFADIQRKRRRATRPQKHSMLGIISLLIGVGSGAVSFLVVLVAGIISAGKNGRVNNNDPAVMMTGLAIIACLAFAVAGLALGGVGCFQNKRNITCAVLGVCINALILLGIGFLMCLGLMMPQ